MSLITDWKRLRNEIRAAPSKAKQLDVEITEALYHYRIHLTELQNKPHLLDRQIWETYDSIIEDLEELKDDSEGRLLRRSSTLSGLMERWHKLFARQRELLELIEQTMERSDFYNKMETAKDRKSREQARQAEIEAKVSKARRGLIQAIHYVLLRERSGESVTAGSMVLDLDQAIDKWAEGLREALSWDEEVTADEQIEYLEDLRNRIVDAPTWAENLKEAEQNLDELLRLEEQQRRMSGHKQLAEADIDEMVDLLRLDATESWVRADWDELESIIDRIQGYIQREYGPLQSQLYVQRKRRGKTLPQERSLPNRRANGRRSRSNSDDQSGTEADRTAAEESGETELGSLARAIHTRPKAAPYARTMIDPDADESIQRAFSRSEPATNDDTDRA